MVQKLPNQTSRTRFKLAFHPIVWTSITTNTRIRDFAGESKSPYRKWWMDSGGAPPRSYLCRPWALFSFTNTPLEPYLCCPCAVSSSTQTLTVITSRAATYIYKSPPYRYRECLTFHNAFFIKLGQNWDMLLTVGYHSTVNAYICQLSLKHAYISQTHCYRSMISSYRLFTKVRLQLAKIGERIVMLPVEDVSAICIRMSYRRL